MARPSRRSTAALLLLTALVFTPLLGCAQNSDSDSAQATSDTTTTPTITLDSDGTQSDVPFVESPQPVVDSMLALAGVAEDDVVYDLGSGDGRIPITAARQYGARGVGIEIKPDLVKEARANADKAGVADRVTFRQGDLFEADIGEASVVTLYLLPSVNMKLRPQLFRQLAPGTRVVSHDFDMNEWEPDSTIEVDGSRLFLWTIPEETPDFVDLTKEQE